MGTGAVDGSACSPAPESSCLFGRSRLISGSLDDERRGYGREHFEENEGIEAEADEAVDDGLHLFARYRHGGPRAVAYPEH
jgi:hypothetical protein